MCPNSIRIQYDFQRCEKSTKSIRDKFTAKSIELVLSLDSV